MKEIIAEYGMIAVVVILGAEIITGFKMLFDFVMNTICM